MAQPELLWAAAGLMLLGVAVSACVRCQLYGKALPWGPWVAVGGCFPPGVSHLRGVVLLEKRRFRGGLRAAFWYPKGCKKGGDRIFSGACCDLARGNGFRLNEGRFWLDMRKKSFTVRVVRLWNRLPGEWWMPHPWRHPKVRLDQALSS